MWLKKLRPEPPSPEELAQSEAKAESLRAKVRAKPFTLAHTKGQALPHKRGQALPHTRGQTLNPSTYQGKPFTLAHT